ncbi:MAG: VanZ family protein [Nocardioides sp.]|nr:VanZ family protein [Nocardioides sp.]
MFHRHPFLSLVTFCYLGFVVWLTLTPNPSGSGWSSLSMRVLARLQREDGFEWLTFERAEFLANVALFVPVGLFLLLLFGTRWWWVAGLGCFVATSLIENVQRTIPGRVSDERDVVANTLGGLVGVLIGVVLTLGSEVRRARARRAQRLTRAG